MAKKAKSAPKSSKTAQKAGSKAKKTETKKKTKASAEKSAKKATASSSAKKATKTAAKKTSKVTERAKKAVAPAKTPSKAGKGKATAVKQVAAAPKKEETKKKKSAARPAPKPTAPKPALLDEEDGGFEEFEEEAFAESVEDEVELEGALESDADEEEEAEAEPEPEPQPEEDEKPPVRLTVEKRTRRRDEVRIDRSGNLEEQWRALYEKAKGIKPVPYNMSDTYEPRTPLMHKVLGWGYVLNNQNDRLEVLFKDGIKILISNYKRS